MQDLYIYINKSNVDTCLKYGIKLSEYSNKILKLQNIEKRGIHAFLSPKDSDLYIDEHPNNYTSGTKYICLNTLQNSGFLSNKLVEDVTKSTDYNGVKVVINNDSKTMEIVNTSSCN